MSYLLGGLGGILVVELLVRLPLAETVREIISTLGKSLHVIRSSAISDHWKERIVLKYSSILLIATLKLAAQCIIALAPLVLLAFLGARIGADVMRFLLTPVGLLYASSVTALYFALRRRKSGATHGLLDRTLHGMALGSPCIAEMSFDLEQVLQKPEPRALVSEKHVFIAGLARAGTTILMRRFYASGKYRSLTYRDMPFVLMPNTWRKLSSLSSKPSHAQERAHRDGIRVGYDSPEALEEVFWRVFAGRDYIRDDTLIPMNARDEVVEKFRSYVATIVTGPKQEAACRYLSKNNNNILRLPSIRRAFPRALIIVPFRDPLQQAFSLLNQHKHFVKEHRCDPYSRKYMNRLAHHEFGADHKRFLFNDVQPKFTNAMELNYWIELWLQTYAGLLSSAPEETLLLSYETLCTDIEDTWLELASLAEIPSVVHHADALSLRDRKVTVAFDEGLLREAKAVYDIMKSRRGSRVNSNVR